MKNYQITAQEDGKQYWISRSCAVSAFIYVIKEDYDICILAVKRGQGSADFQGLWCCPCGYIDWDETASQACSREIAEEAGFKIEIDDQPTFVNSNPHQNLQNISLHFTKIIYEDELIRVNNNDGEKNEIDDIQLISLYDINNYAWAFNHDKFIKNHIKELNKYIYRKYFE